MYQSAKEEIDYSVCNESAGVVQRKCASVDTEIFGDHVEIQTLGGAAKAKGYHYQGKADGNDYPFVVEALLGAALHYFFGFNCSFQKNRLQVNVKMLKMYINR